MINIFLKLIKPLGPLDKCNASEKTFFLMTRKVGKHYIVHKVTLMSKMDYSLEFELLGK
jgi:hypothetical protein